MRAPGAALQELLSAARLPEPARHAVLRRMGMPHRHYHGLGHIAVLWTRHRRYGTGTPFLAPAANRLVACAIAFHDAVYDGTRRDNEHRSALLWQRYAPHDLSRVDVGWVSDTIEATANHLVVHDAATQAARLRLWLLDLDLTPLGDPANPSTAAPAGCARSSGTCRKRSGSATGWCSCVGCSRLLHCIAPPRWRPCSRSRHAGISRGSCGKDETVQVSQPLCVIARCGIARCGAPKQSPAGTLEGDCCGTVRLTKTIGAGTHCMGDGVSCQRTVPATSGRCRTGATSA